MGVSTGGYALGSVVGVRVAGSPVHELEQLRLGEAWELAEEHAGLIEWLRAEGEELADLLFLVIGRCADGALKAAVVALRRAVFRGRRPSARAWSEQVRDALPDDVSDRITAWLDTLSMLETLRAKLPAVLAADLMSATEALRAAAAGQNFRLALLSGSSELAEALGRWLDGPGGRPPRPQVLLRVAKYLARAVAKTSPYASFTLSGLGGWSTQRTGDTHTGDLSWRGVAELDRRYADRIWDELAADPDLAEHVAVRVNPSAISREGKLGFLGAARGEPVLQVDATDALERLLAGIGNDTPTLAEVREAGAGRLVELGLLERVRPFDDQDPDPLDALTQWLDSAGPTSMLHGVPAALARLRTQVRNYGVNRETAIRPARIRRLRDNLSSILTQVSGRVPEWLPDKELVRENAVITHPVAVLDESRWRPVLDDLATLRGLLGVFNPHLPIRMGASAFFSERYPVGATVEFLRFYRDFHTAHPDTEPTDELHQARRAAVASLYAAAPRMNPAALGKITASWPADFRAPLSICCYGQPLPGPRLVVNTVCTGYGWGINRVHHLIGQTDRPPAPWPAPGVGDPVPVECRASFGSQLNLRPAATSYTIDYPGARLGQDTPTRLRLNELSVARHPVHDRLMVRGPRGVELNPLPLGMLVEHALPPALYFLVRVFGEPQTALAPGRQLGGNAVWRTGPDGLRRRPRLEMGHLVLVRAGWSMPVGSLPRRVKGESDTEYLLRVAAWRRQHGMPRRGFVRVLTPDPGNAMNKDHKPLYLDLADWFLLTAFERSLERVDPEVAVIFEEALPDLGDAPRYGEHGQCVTEYVLQISGPDNDA